MENDDDLNYWPSFVDLMSSLFIVILTIFFILFLSQQYLSFLVGRGEKDLQELKKILEGKVISGVIITDDGRIKIGGDIFFNLDSDELTDSGKVIIASIGNSLKQFFEADLLRKVKFSIVVEGHTDTKGNNEHNKNLSFKRAKKVTDTWEYLLSFGIQSDSLYDILPAGYGESRLAFRTDDEVLEPGNRRVEIRVVPKFYEMLKEIIPNGK